MNTHRDFARSLPGVRHVLQAQRLIDPRPRVPRVRHVPAVTTTPTKAGNDTRKLLQHNGEVDEFDKTPEASHELGQ